MMNFNEGQTNAKNCTVSPNYSKEKLDNAHVKVAKSRKQHKLTKMAESTRNEEASTRHLQNAGECDCEVSEKVWVNTI